jgi:uncharacterized membrane protein
MDNKIKKDLKKSQQNMLTLYIGLFISAIFQFIPSAGAQVFGVLFFGVLLIAAYVYRTGADEDSLQYSHAQYVIKSIWIFSLFLFIGVMLASVLADNTAIQETMDKAKGGVMMSESELESIMSGYVKNNLWVFITSLGPSFIYFFYRLIKGVKLVRQNTNIPNPKSWV